MSHAGLARLKFAIYLLLPISLLLSGCRKAVDDGHFQLIKPNMTLQEVESLLRNKGTDANDEEVRELLKSASKNEKSTLQNIDSYHSLQWMEGSRKIIIVFLNNRVQKKFKKGF